MEKGEKGESEESAGRDGLMLVCVCVRKFDKFDIMT